MSTNQWCMTFVILSNCLSSCKRSKGWQCRNTNVPHLLSVRKKSQRVAFFCRISRFVQNHAPHPSQIPGCFGGACRGPLVCTVVNSRALVGLWSLHCLDIFSDYFWKHPPCWSILAWLAFFCMSHALATRTSSMVSLTTAFCESFMILRPIQRVSAQTILDA